MPVSGKLNVTRMSAASCDELDLRIIDNGDAAGTIIITGSSNATRMKAAVSNSNERNPLRKAWIACVGPCVKALCHAMLWLPNVLAARRDFDVLTGMSERELKDIGLTRADVGDVTALPSDASPTEFLAARVKERRLAKRECMLADAGLAAPEIRGASKGLAGPQ